MAKKVKTRKQKILADLRRSSNSTGSKKADSTVYSLPIQKTFPSVSKSTTPQVPIKISTQLPISTSTYHYLAHDLKKTLFLTASIVIAQLLIKYFIK